MNTPAGSGVRLKQSFRDRMAETGLSDAALAAAIGVTPQFFHQVKTGQCAPSARFMAGAVVSGLAPDFGDVAWVVRTEEAGRWTG